jgi:uncharacterized protein YjdB
MNKLLLLVLACVLSLSSRGQTKTAYFFGNSVTDGINIIGLDNMATQAGKTFNWGRHVIPGAPLDWIYNHPADGFNEEPYGLYPNAMPNYDFDVVSFQPFDRRENDDLPAIQNFINLAGARKTNCQYLIYGRWPRMPNNLDNPNDGNLTADVWSEIWDKAYTGPGKFDGTEESRAYFETLTRAVRASVPGIKKTFIVPVGEVMYQLNLKMKAGQVAGYSKIWNIYEDGIHLTTAGSLIPATTYYATIYGVDPRGVTVPSTFGSLSVAYINAVQQTVWEVLNNYKDTDGSTWSGFATSSISVTGVSLTPTTATIVAGNSVSLTTTVAPSDATNKAVSFSSSNAGVAIVNSTGVVTGVAAGTATITVTTADGGKTSSSNITVTPNSGNVAVTGISVNPTTAILNPASTLQLTPTIAPVNATNKNVTWASSNTAVATVSSSGLVTAVAAGNVTITVNTADGNKTATASLRVNGSPTAIISANPASGTAPLTVIFGSSASSDPDAGDYILGYDWDFGDGTPNSNSNAPVHTFTSAGTYNVTLRVMDNNNLYSSPVNILITANGSGGGQNIASAGIASTWTNMTSSTGNTTKVASTGINDNITSVDVVLPDVSAAGNWQAAGIVWSIAQSGITSLKYYNGNHIDDGFDNGSFTANAKLQTSTDGTSWTDVNGWTITPAYPYSAAASDQVYTFSGSALTNVRGIRVVGQVRTNNTSWSIKVKELQVLNSAVPVTGVTVSPTSASLLVGSTQSLVATIAPANATNNTVNWTSSNTSVATVNSNGLVTAVAAGSAIITVTTADGNRTASSSITVTTSGGNSSNIALTGIASAWTDLTSSTANTTKMARAGINDNNTSVDVVLPDVSLEGNWQAAGIVWSTSQSGITSVNYYNGNHINDGFDNGSFTANAKLQTSGDGTTWTDVNGWTVAPAYPYSAAASDQVYSFSGPTLNNVRGIRLVGQVRTNNTSWSIKVKEFEVFNSSGQNQGGTISPVSASIDTDSFLPVQQSPYPNPATGSINLPFTMSKDERIQITLFNQLGMVVKTQKVEVNKGKNLIRLNLTGIKPGIYFINVVTKSQHHHYKIGVN